MIDKKNDLKQDEYNLNNMEILVNIESVNINLKYDLSIRDLSILAVAGVIAYQTSKKLVVSVRDKKGLKVCSHIDLEKLIKYFAIDFITLEIIFDEKINQNYIIKDLNSMNEMNEEYKEERSKNEIWRLYQVGYPAIAVNEYLFDMIFPDFHLWRKKNSNESLVNYPIHSLQKTIEVSKLNHNLLYKTSKNIIAEMIPEKVYELSLRWAKEFINELAVFLRNDKDYAINILNIDRNSNHPRKDIGNWQELKDNIGYFYDLFFEQELNYQYNIVEKLTNYELLVVIINEFKKFYSEINNKDEWNEKIKLTVLQEMVFEKYQESYDDSKELKNQINHILLILRVMITGKRNSYDLYEIMQIIGKKRVFERLDKSLECISTHFVGYNFLVTNDLKKLANNISCYFMDYRTTSKGNVKKFADENVDMGFKVMNEYLAVKTCLRQEYYILGKTECEFQDMYYVSGVACVRRLFSILVGLQSEIEGEREIIWQFKNALDKAFSERRISEKNYKAILCIYDISLIIRDKCNLNTYENYSTIAAALLEKKLSWEHQPVVMVIGAGYMANVFYNYINNKVSKLIWANRDTKKILDIVRDSPYSKQNLLIYKLEDCKALLPIVDAIFIAISDHENFLDLKDMNMLNKSCCVIDISFPQAAFDNGSVELYNINNTRFNLLVNHQVEKKDIIKANKEIDDVIHIISNKGE